MQARFPLALATALALALAPRGQASVRVTGGEGPPRSMKHLVLHSGHRQVQTVKLGSTDFRFLALRDDLPFVLWPEQGQSVPFSRDEEEVQRWLAAQLPALGVQEFEPYFDEAWNWRANDVWTFRLRHEGLELHDARVDFHWLNGEFQGVRVLVERPILSLASLPEPGAQASDVADERVWFCERKIRGAIDGYDVVLADVSRAVEGPHVRTSYSTGGGQMLATIVSTTSYGPHQETHGHEWTEYNVPSGTFPDQLGTDSGGRVWFSQPNNNKVTVFDPTTATFSSPTSTMPSPDGMIVDSQDRLWTGLYNANAGLGMVDTLTATYVNYPPTYPGATMALPFETAAGEIWVTDHLLNRVSIFDPNTTTFTSVMVMPTPNCWVVDGAQDPVTQTMYFQEYNTDKIAIKPLGQPMFDIPTPSGGPAFVVHSQGKIYMGMWHVGRLGVYDIATGQFTTHDYPDPTNPGGPVAVLSNGDVVACGRNVGAIYIFRVATQTFDRYLTPTAGAGIKDGLHVDANDVIWLTETNANKLAKLRLQ